MKHICIRRQVHQYSSDRNPIKTYFYQEKEEVYNYERNCDGQSGNNV